MHFAFCLPSRGYFAYYTKCLEMLKDNGTTDSNTRNHYKDIRERISLYLFEYATSIQKRFYAKKKRTLKLSKLNGL